MEESDPDPDQYQAELNDAVDDGGGCVETWEKLSEKRKEPALNRRSVLAASSAAAFSLLSVGFLPTEVTANDNTSGEDSEIHTEVEELTGSQENKAVKQALTDEGIKELMRLARQNKNKVEINNAIATESTYKNHSYLTVVFPVDTDRPGKRREQESTAKYQEAQITWSSRDGAPPGYTVTTYEDTGEDTAKAEINSRLFQNGEITSENRTITTADYREAVEEVTGQMAGTEDVSTQAVFFGPCGVCLPDFNCIYRLARRYATELVVCGDCYISKRPASCAGCIAALFEEGLTGLCDPCPGPTPFC
jgi:hypothetical protein